MNRVIRKRFAFLGISLALETVVVGVSGAQQTRVSSVEITHTYAPLLRPRVHGAGPSGLQAQVPAQALPDIITGSHKIHTPGLTSLREYASSTRPASTAQRAVVSGLPFNVRRVTTGGSLRGNQSETKTEDRGNMKETETFTPQLHQTHASESETGVVEAERPESTSASAAFPTDNTAQHVTESGEVHQDKTREKLRSPPQRDSTNLLDSEKQKGSFNEAKSTRREVVGEEAKQPATREEVDEPLAVKEVIRMKGEQNRKRVHIKKAPYINAPNRKLEKGSRKAEDADACCGIEETETRMSDASLSMLYYFNPDSVMEFHTVSLLLPDGKTFLADVESVVRDPPPTEDDQHPKSVAHLSGGYTLTLSLDGVTLEDGDDDEIASWGAERVLYPVILEEVAIRDTSAVAVQATRAGSLSNDATSTVPVSHPETHFLQEKSASDTQDNYDASVTAGLATDFGSKTKGGEADSSSVYSAGPVGFGEAERSANVARKIVRVLAVSRGNIGTVRISTTRSVAPGMSAFTCVFRTGIYGDFDPCNTPAVIAANFFTPLTASIIGGF
ncbi:hypothetical protein TGMAS_239570 [Toxoplasma gondii MAS]|uniref:Transmembrane protein n=1 Tax=Toxoplasma gondii MAS TaxID=943118 RepID=A0A086QQ63_TOXGO|nr:hypothetical protein TGMAS_239570 [Toxoplasma gondii MAS]